MIFSYKVAGGSAWAAFYSDQSTDANVFDSSSGTGEMPVYQPSFSAESTKAGLALSQAAFRSPRGNVRASLRLDYTNHYASLADSFNAVQTVKAALMTTPNTNVKLVHLSVQQAGATTIYFPNGVLSSVSADVQGASCRFNMQWETDDATTTSP